MTTKTLLKRVRIEPIRTDEALAAIVIETAKLQLERDKIIIERDEAKQLISEQHSLAIEQLDNHIDSNTKRLHHWSNTNREARFKDRQSILVASHKLAFQKSPGKVEYQAGIKAGDALDFVLAADDETDTERFTAIKPTLDKNALIKAWEQGDAQRAIIRSFGIEIIKPETFNFTPNREEIPDITITS